MDRSFTMKLTAAAGGGRVCDLCHEQQPSFYCSSDSAFLCSDCDSQVHTANFLVARHVRFSICSLCKSYHSTTTCHDDDDVDDALSSSSSSSSSFSTTKTINSNNYKTSSSSSVVVDVSSSISSSDSKTRDVLVDWCTRVVIEGGSSTSSGVIIEVARHAFQVWWQDRRRRRLVWPYRVGLAASLWLGLLRSFTLIKDDNNNKRSAMRLMLKRLEEISGVPAKSIVVAQSKLAAATLKHRPHQDDEEESWAEC